MGDPVTLESEYLHGKKRRSTFVPVADPHGYISGTKAALVIICFVLAFLMGAGVGFIVGRIT